MTSFSNSSAIQLWTIGLCVAVTLVGVSLAAFFVYLSKQRSARKEVPEDPQLQSLIAKRLSQLAETSTLPKEGLV